MGIFNYQIKLINYTTMSYKNKKNVILKPFLDEIYNKYEISNKIKKWFISYPIKKLKIKDQLNTLFIAK